MSRPKAHDQTNKRRDGSATVYLPPHLIGWLKQDADRAGRSFSNYLSRIIETYAEHAGYTSAHDDDGDNLIATVKQLLLEASKYAKCFVY